MLVMLCPVTSEVHERPSFMLTYTSPFLSMTMTMGLSGK